jgi:DNA-binding NarL/FixJ family response regulator
VVSQVDSEMNVRRALECGVSGYLPQSCQPDQLIDATLALARGQRYLERSVAQRLADAMTQDLPTPREIDVLRLMAIGLCNKAISSELNIAVGTVKAHIKALLQKLEAATRTEAADVARRRGLLGPADDEIALSRDRRRAVGRPNLRGALAVGGVSLREDSRRFTPPDGARVR